MEYIGDNAYLKELYDNRLQRKIETLVTKMWKHSRGLCETLLEITHLPSKGIDYLIDILRKAGVETFIVTYTGRHLLARLRRLELSCGCKILGTCSIDATNAYGDYYSADGIMVKILNEEEAAKHRISMY